MSESISWAAIPLLFFWEGLGVELIASFVLPSPVHKILLCMYFVVVVVDTEGLR